MMEIGVWVPCYKSWVKREEAGRLAEVAEEMSFDGLWVQDHLVAPVGSYEEAPVEAAAPWLNPDDYGNEKYSAVEYFGEENWWLDPYALWGFLAGRTSKVKLGSCIVVLPYRDPISQAKMLGTLDVLSGGRMMFGVGAGHVESEFRAVGKDFADRGSLMDEYLQVVKALLSNDEVEWDGKHVSFQRVRTLIDPVQKPHPPILIGGNSKRAVRRAVELGDAWFPAMVAPDELSVGLRYLEELSASHGRDVPPAVGLTLSWGIQDPSKPPKTSSRRRMREVSEIAELLISYRDLGVAFLAIDVPNPSLEITLRQYELLYQGMKEAGLRS